MTLLPSTAVAKPAKTALSHNSTDNVLKNDDNTITSTNINLSRNPKTIPKSIAPNTEILTGIMDANTSSNQPIRIEHANQYGRVGVGKDETEDNEIARASKVSLFMGGWGKKQLVTMYTFRRLTEVTEE